MPDLFTTAEAARTLTDRMGVRVPEWKVRRVSDALDFEIQRFGPYRLLTANNLDAIEESLRESGWKGGKVTTCQR